MSNVDDIITLDVRPHMDKGLTVYDVEGNRVGTVEDYDLRAGYMKVRPKPLSATLVYIPFILISHIDPREAFVSMSRDELHHEFSDPPPRSTVVEARSDPDTGEDTSRAFTSEPSGYDGTPVLVAEANVGELAHHIAPGFRVYSSEMEPIGRVKEYYREDKHMLVERGLVSKQDSIIPVALAATVDRDNRHVVLAVSAADLSRQARPVADHPELDEVVLAGADPTEMRAEAPSQHPFGRIVVALDGSAHAEQVLSYVEPLARALHSQLICVYAVEPESAIYIGETSVPAGFPPPGVLAQAQEEVRVRDAGYLAHIKGRLAGEGFDVQCEEPEGRAAEAVVASARRHKADLIAMTTHARSGLKRAVVGSVATEVVRKAPCPVLLVRSSVPSKALIRGEEGTWLNGEAGESGG